MLAEQRRQRILDLLAQNGAVSVAELNRALDVSRETVRRDIVYLAERNALRKTHGGALAVVEEAEPGFESRKVVNVIGKQVIGRHIAGLIPNGASIILDSGTTTQAVAEALLEHDSLVVYTNDLRIVSLLAGRNGNRVYVLGGEVNPGENATLGHDAVEMLSHYFADFSIIGISAVSPRGWIMDYSREGAQLRGRMIGAARVSCVAVDSTKFNRFAPVRVEGFEAATMLVTDRAPEPPAADALADLPVRLVVASGGT